MPEPGAGRRTLLPPQPGPATLGLVGHTGAPSEIGWSAAIRARGRARLAGTVAGEVVGVLRCAVIAQRVRRRAARHCPVARRTALQDPRGWRPPVAAAAADWRPPAWGRKRFRRRRCSAGCSRRCSSPRRDRGGRPPGSRDRRAAAKPQPSRSLESSGRPAGRSSPLASRSSSAVRTAPGPRSDRWYTARVIGSSGPAVYALKWTSVTDPSAPDDHLSLAKPERAVQL